MKKLRKIFVILSQAWDKAKNLSPLVELNLGPSDSVLKFSNHLHSGWLCWLKMKSHTSIITTQWSSNYQYVHHWISLCWKSKCKRWKLVNWYYLNELLHLNWKFLVSSVGLANTVCSVEPTANEFSKLWDCCWGALRIYLHCCVRLHFHTWQSKRHNLYMKALSLKINEGALFLLMTMSKELKDVSCPIFIFILIVHFSRFNSWPSRETSILLLVTISPLKGLRRKWR